MAPRALLLGVALCVFQTSQADLLPSFGDILNSVKNLQQTTENKMQSIYTDFTNAVSDVENGIISDVTSASSNAQTEVDNLISQAEADGISVAECSIAAAANLTRINLNLPISLGHCAVDYLDAFNYYILNVERDFSLMFTAITNGTKEMTKCFIDIPCYWNIFSNVTKFEIKKEENIAYQVLNAQTAGINLIATISLCNKEKSTQALLDLVLVVPQTVKCIQQKRDEASAATSN